RVPARPAHGPRPRRRRRQHDPGGGRRHRPRHRRRRTVRSCLLLPRFLTRPSSRRPNMSDRTPQPAAHPTTGHGGTAHTGNGEATTVAGAPGAEDVVIRVENVAAGYADNVVLRGVTFDVRRGERFVIAGGS